jgi:hypothetical protein
LTQNVVRAKKFELVDDYENVYASLEQDQYTGSAALMFYDDDQVFRVGVGINESRTGFVNLRDANGKGGVRVAVEENGSAVVRLRDAQDRERYNLAYSAPGTSDLAPEDALNLSFLDENRRPRIQLGISSPGGDATLILYDQNGAEAATLSISGQDGSVLALHDGQGRVRAGMMVDADGNPMLAFLDEDGTMIGE